MFLADAQEWRSHQGSSSRLSKGQVRQRLKGSPRGLRRTQAGGDRDLLCPAPCYMLCSMISLNLLLI